MTLNAYARELGNVAVATGAFVALFAALMVGAGADVTGGRFGMWLAIVLPVCLGLGGVSVFLGWFEAAANAVRRVKGNA